MNKKIVTTVLAGAIFMTSALPLAVQAGRGGGQMGGTSLQTRNPVRDQSRLRDGSCTTGTATQTGSMFKKGNIYGPGDGTGNAGIGPKDGTGYGAPANR